MLRISILVLAVFVAIDARAESCAPVEAVVPQTLATAGSWQNLRGSAGSLKFESMRMLKLLEERSSSARCSEGCAAGSQPTMTFTSIPNAFLKEYSESVTCEARLKETSTTPIRYQDRRFSSLEELSAWYAEFSQGNGKDGTDLYSKCPGSCSPQYTLEFSKQESGYVVDSSVVCGHARDKGDNQYRLNGTLRLSCTAAK